MKRIILAIAVLGLLFFLSTPVMADGGRGPHTYYHNDHRGGYPGRYYGGYSVGYGYQVYTPVPMVPAWQAYPTVNSTMFPNATPIYPRAVVQSYYPGAGFYYYSPGVSIRIGY
jgi:hypothetical protein